MKFELFPFQMNAVRRLRKFLMVAQANYKLTDVPQAISFTAPTGAGKTIMLAALVEQVYRGDGNYPAQPDAIFVWLSDSPELNQQSCDKFYFNADGINHSQLFMIEDDKFDQQTLDDGKIYFLNTQKLGKGSNLTKHSDLRQYTIWETLRNTVKAKTDKIYFIIDEAHRGMKDNAAARATTIMQKFIKGSSDDKFEPVPVVIGMSATPARFNNLVAKSSATIHRVVVETEDVKASGLLKERIIVIYPDEQTSTAIAKDMAILEAASDEWKNKCEHWRQYISEQNTNFFNPIFVVQVSNGSSGRTSDTNLDECLKKISQRTGITFEVGEVVHTFGETTDLTINGLKVQYRNPSSISGDDKIRVVFFKENLSTGWDCPQAETMMSFRRAVDATYIAQLLGRMIRTPMRRHIEGDDTLNEVRLYLPYFDKGTVQEIVRELQQSEGEAIPTEIIGESLSERKIDTLTVKGVARIPARHLGNFQTTEATNDNKNRPSIRSETQPDNLTRQHLNHSTTKKIFLLPRSETPTDNFMLTLEGMEIKPTTETDAKKISPVQALFDREKIVRAINAMGLSTYKVRSERINDYLKSLFQMAHFLTRSLLAQSAFDDILDDVAAFISNYIDELKASGEYSALYQQAKEFKLSAQVFDAFGENVTQIISQDLFVTTDTDIERQFRQAEAVLKNEGVSNRYLQKILDAGYDIEDGKIDVILFVVNLDCLVNLERFAKTKFHNLCDRFRRKTVTLPSNLANEYNSIVWNGDEVSKYNFSLPATISMPHDVNGKEYSDHLFVDEATGTATIKLDGWEEGVLREEQKRKDFVCWLRNRQRASWSLAIPYDNELNETKSFFPDFLIVRHNEDGYVVDILEPHDPNQRDNIGKAKGFANYAKENQISGRLQLIREKKILGQKVFTRLDMSKAEVFDRVCHASSNGELDSIFDSLGQA